MKKSSVFMSMMLIALMCVPFALTSCEKEIVSGPNSYTCELIELDTACSSSAEMAAIKYTYLGELASLDISSTSFTMEGNTSDCDNKIIAACKRAEEELKKSNFLSSYRWHVTRHSVNNNVTEIYSYKIEAVNPTTVSFAYETFETENMLEYCNIVIEYSDGTETKSDTITGQSWIMSFEKQQLPCTFTFKKYYTLKEDKDMASLNPVSFYPNGCYKYVSVLHDENGALVYNYQDETPCDTMKSKGSTVAEKISTGYFNTVNTFKFSDKGRLTVSTKK